MHTTRLAWQSTEQPGQHTAEPPRLQRPRPVLLDACLLAWGLQAKSMDIVCVLLLLDEHYKSLGLETKDECYS